ncbi:MAG: xanthine dehydrogenase, partial [Chloroflexi bacterium]|nr:xanthine dehydrogenase [Chloroflexota bacterium]
MKIDFTLNGQDVSFDVAPNDTLLRALRKHGFFGAKFGDEYGVSGSDTVLLDGRPVLSGMILVSQVAGRNVTTIEGVGGTQERGWRGSEPLHALQEAFVETGAIQCGYETPAFILCALALLEQNPAPSEADVREALAGVLSRDTGYVKPVQAVLRAAAVLRGEPVDPIDTQGAIPAPPDLFKSPEQPISPEEPVVGAGGGSETRVRTSPLPVMTVTPEAAKLKQVGKPRPKVDARKLVQGKPAFADDVEMRGMLTAKVLWSPHAHATIKHI